MLSDPVVLLATLAAAGILIIWSCGDQAVRIRRKVHGGTRLLLICLEVAVALLGFAIVVTILATAERTAACWGLVRRSSARALASVGQRWCCPRWKVETMRDRDWIGWVRRDVRVAAELAAVAEAALRSIQETGGTPLERAGVLRIVGMARGGAISAMEQLDAVERRERLGSFGGTG